MIAVSDAWKERQKQTLLPEGFVEIAFMLTENGVQAAATKSVTAEGYTLTLPTVHTVAIPGITITWGNSPAAFTVTAKNGTNVVAETTVTDNTDTKSLVSLHIADYDSVTVKVEGWNESEYDVGIESVVLGLDMTFTKQDLLNFTHEQAGNVISGELPKNSIIFSVDNRDGRWNPSNPVGLTKYLSARQQFTLRYGLDVGDTIEWINGGVFYLSEWRAPTNGLSAEFVARDLLEFMLVEAYTGITKGSLLDIAKSAIRQANLPTGTRVVLDDALSDYAVVNFGEKYEPGDYTIAEVLQMCANASKCAFYQDNEGVLQIRSLSPILGSYEIPRAMSYTWPEIDVSKTLRSILVTYVDNNKYELTLGSNGEKQTVENPLIRSREHAADIALWVKESLLDRKVLTGEYRADPRLVLFDCVAVDSKFGHEPMLLITNVKYTFSGTLRGKYTGWVITETLPQCGEIYCGEV